MLGDIIGTASSSWLPSAPVANVRDALSDEFAEERALSMGVPSLPPFWTLREDIRVRVRVETHTHALYRYGVAIRGIMTIHPSAPPHPFKHFARRQYNSIESLLSSLFPLFALFF